MIKTRHIGVFPFEFDAPATAPVPNIPTEIHLIPLGQWDHDQYGTISITPYDISQFVQNFNAGIRKGVPITAGHEGFDELPAIAWITAVDGRDTGLWGTVQWNEQGKALLSDRAFKFFSPEFFREYEDPQTHQIFNNVLTGGALTKSPYFKELEAVVFSEPRIKNQFNDNKTMDLITVLAKDITTLTDDEKAFIKTNAAQLTDDQKASHAAVIEEPTGTEETAEEKTAREAREVADKATADAAAAEATAKAEADAAAAAAVEASEKKSVTMSFAEATLLRKKADEGAQAFAELQKQKTDTAVAALVFSESNKAGKFLPKSEPTLRTFMATLNDTQRATFSTLLSELPKAQIFGEIGSGTTATEGTALAEVEAKISAKMSEAKVSYSEAARLVMSENAGLEERYDTELPSARKA